MLETVKLNDSIDIIVVCFPDQLDVNVVEWAPNRGWGFCQKYKGKIELLRSHS